MESIPESMKEAIRASMLATGATAVGFAKAGDLPESVISQYESWIGEGCAAGMEYLRRHIPLKTHPRHVLGNAATVISMAFSYAPPGFRSRKLPMIACYAYGDDYHDVLRDRLRPVVASLQERFGGEWRICIDSAPLAERYWAVRSGIGKRGRNGSVIVEECGCYNFLVEVLTSVCVAPDEPAEGFNDGFGCQGCGACLKACPQNALREDGTVDSRRCLNYLTIEHRGAWEGETLDSASTPAARNTIFGCDTCLRVCPHNHGIPPTGIAEFHPREMIMDMTAESVSAMTDMSALKGSPLRRAKLADLVRNAKNCLENPI